MGRSGGHALRTAAGAEPVKPVARGNPMSNAVAELRRASSSERPAPSSVVVAPVTPTIGAEISGVDLRQPLDAATVEAIRGAIRDWRVIFFRDQSISNDQLKAFGRYFGPLTPAHPIADGLEDHPEIWERSIE